MGTQCDGAFGGRRCSGVQVGDGLFRVVVIHEGLLDVEIGRQLVFVELHVRGNHFKCGEKQSADGAAVHEGT